METESNEKQTEPNTIKDEELQELLNDGISVWGQYQSVVEKQALSHFQSLTEKTKEDGEISESDDTNQEAVKKPEKKTQIKGLDIKQFLARQEEMKNNYLKKKLSNVSDKSKEIAEKISKLSNVSDKSKEIAEKISKRQTYSNEVKKHKKKRKYSENTEERPETSVVSNNEIDPRHSKRHRTEIKEPQSIEGRNNDLNYNLIKTDKNPSSLNPSCSNSSPSIPSCSNRPGNNDSGSEYYPSDIEYNSDSDYVPDSSIPNDQPLDDINRKETKPKKKSSVNKKINRVKDDALLNDYKNRLSTYTRDTSHEDFIVGNGLKVPGELWMKLYDYQQDGIEWLWNLHRKDAGGLLGDEMGLGKTVQIIVFLAAVQYSQLKDHIHMGLGPVLIISPVTVVHQWVKHFHTWWPPFRVVLLHHSSTHASTSNKNELIRRISRENGIIITNYESVLKYKGILLEQKWHYIILDEGHKIRNPTAKITVAVKQFRGTCHRIMLTGSPMQNNLIELWSLFDFIVPGRLGTQQVFTDHFATPIIQGGYSNATQTQETTALLIATSLKDMITPYMLRRSKNDVGDSIMLPEKSEQVLFCSLTDEQRDLYRGYLISDHVGLILGRTSGKCTDYQKRASMLVAITTLRKICNHPDLYLGEAPDSNGDPHDPQFVYGHYKRSGKMIVVSALLKIWKRQGHRVLLFSQTRLMIEIFQDMLTAQEYKFLKMDGNTPITSRQPLIDKFNNDTSYDVFLLTTKVGGLGVNLTGANRVIIYDPDWNPATDLQARERAWRIGQSRQVTIYRLVTAGTIEEKMYQRQVWKQLLSNKVLIDPRTHRFFKHSDLNELFSLQELTDTNPETANIFRNSKVDVDPERKKPKITKPSVDVPVSFSEDKIQAMKNLAQEISKKFTKKTETKEVKKNEIRLTPIELLALNRKKLEPKPPEPIVNKVDEVETNISFSDALDIVTDVNKGKKRCGDDDVIVEKTEKKKGRYKNKEIHENKNETHENKKETHENKKETHENKNETHENKKETHENKKARQENKKETHENKKETHENKKETHENKNERQENKNETHENKKETHENKKETHENKNERQENKNETHENKKETHENKKETHENKKETRENKNDRHENKKETHENKNDRHEKDSKREHKKKKKNKKNKEKVKVDISGKLEGEQVEGLVKIEYKRKKKEQSKSDEQDDYVLGKLFSKKGVQTALQHDVIVQSGYKPGNSLRVHYEAKQKADMALKALRKSRINSWRY